ncbi:MAG: hypothetical protein OMM_06064 [Candidatus Magnetoglobus multicellularis str. Araruama]|uniref:Uncharacterized protein n=1 Tax=Candidatus Magnetoglobus multicellularis str. Araruama TaxID=890399 RepID=A0A1V1NS27_9BACT|nr:MAG: hypothetical protein OMM_06064 [Candidatus Magnetoglobus multicellularis str. Araruama]
MTKFARSVQWLLHGLWQIWFNYQGGEKMEYKMTPEQLQKMGEMWGDDYLSSQSPQRLLRFVPVHERLKDVPVHERLKDIPVHERLKDVPIHERLRDVPVHERLRDVPVHERLRDVPVHERLRDVPIQEAIKGIQDLMKGIPSDEIKSYYETLGII